MGTEARVGVTHFSIMLANYLSAIHKERAAIIEWNKCSVFSVIQALNDLSEKKDHNMKGFTIGKVDYYKMNGKTLSADIFDGDYSYIIMDCGVLKPAINKEYLMCNDKVIISDLGRWNFIKFIRQYKMNPEAMGNGKWNYLSIYGDKKCFKEIKFQCGVDFERIPFNADPYRINRVIFDFFQRYE